jgi:hypothetical protein
MIPQLPDSPLIVAFVVLEKREQVSATGELVARRVTVFNVGCEETCGFMVLPLSPVRCQRVQHVLEFILRHEPSPANYASSEHHGISHPNQSEC